MLVVAPILIGLAYVAAMSLLREPHRRHINALMVAGAGAAYLSSGGVGAWELAFTAVMTYCAYRGLSDYRWIGAGWLMHACWDTVHAIRGVPILPFARHSSAGCAICDPVIAVWCLSGGRPLKELLRHLGTLLRRPLDHVTRDVSDPGTHLTGTSEAGRLSASGFTGQGRTPRTAREA
jgi:hypothetical protein